MTPIIFLVFQRSWQEFGLTLSDLAPFTARNSRTYKPTRLKSTLWGTTLSGIRRKITITAGNTPICLKSREIRGNLFQVRQPRRQTRWLPYYLGYIKFGIGRATSDTAHEIRDNKIDRDEGIALSKDMTESFQKNICRPFSTIATSRASSLRMLWELEVRSPLGEDRQRVVFEKSHLGGGLLDGKCATYRSSGCQRSKSYQKHKSGRAFDCRRSSGARNKILRAGIDELIYIDLVASLYRRNKLPEIVEKAATAVYVPMTVGGGIRSTDDVQDLLLAGLTKVVNSSAICNPNLIEDIAERFGSQCMVLSIEAQKKMMGGRHITTMAANQAD